MYNLENNFIVEKSWGREVIFANNQMYCGKLLIYDKAGSTGSMHFHIKKHETFYVQQGKFCIKWIDTSNAQIFEKILNQGDVWINEPIVPHQLKALVDNSIIFEVSTTHYDDDSYRVMSGNDR